MIRRWLHALTGCPGPLALQNRPTIHQDGTIKLDGRVIAKMVRDYTDRLNPPDQEPPETPAT